MIDKRISLSTRGFDFSCDVKIIEKNLKKFIQIFVFSAVLTLYLLNVLKFSDNVSTVFFNGFTVLCYLTPLLGSVVADGYIGKFKLVNLR